MPIRESSQPFVRLRPLSTVAVIAVFGAAWAATTLLLLKATDGHLVYALDDPYIHMAIARNLAQHGTWGVHADAFASASSSPLWTATLALAFAVVGVHDALPLLLNLVCAIVALLIAGRRMSLHGIDTVPRTAILIGVILFTPLAGLVWLGMEHSMMVLFTLAVTMATTDLVAGRSSLRRTCVLAALLVATRYEGLFVLAGGSLVLMLAGRRRAAGALTLAGLTPVVATGLWYQSHGWFFLPASVLMKQSVLTADSRSIVTAVARNIVDAQMPAALLALLGAAALLLAARGRHAIDRRSTPLVVFVVAVVLHTVCAKYGYLYRYESHLVALGVWAVGVELASWPASWRRGSPDAVTVIGVLVMAVLAFGERTVRSHGQIATTAGHIYRQQWQMGRFLGRFYDSDAVALNDIGAVAYQANTRVHDLMGLSSLEAAEGRRHNQFAAADINRWLDREGVRVAVIYDALFVAPRDFQTRWYKVAVWRTDAADNLEAQVAYYARDPESAETLRIRLLGFADALPAGTRQMLVLDTSHP